LAKVVDVWCRASAARHLPPICRNLPGRTVILITYQMAATIGGPTSMSVPAKEARNSASGHNGV